MAPASHGATPIFAWANFDISKLGNTGPKLCFHHPKTEDDISLTNIEIIDVDSKIKH